MDGKVLLVVPKEGVTTFEMPADLYGRRKDIEPTAEPCPACGGIGRVEGPLHLDAADIWDCPKCDGKGTCRPA